MAESELDALLLRVRNKIDESRRIAEYARQVAKEAREQVRRSLNGKHPQRVDEELTSETTFVTNRADDAYVKS